MKKCYLNYQYAEIARRRTAGEKGKMVITVGREQLMTWAENFISDFNVKESDGRTNIIVPCLKVGQNCF